MRLKHWRVGLLGFLVMLTVACTQVAPAPQPSNAPTTPQASVPTAKLLVAAAASLQKPLQEITPLYQQAHPNQTIDYNFAASGALQQQIEQGAPVDIFISAASKQMKALQEKNLLAPGTKDLLTNQLVLITPKTTSVPLTDFQDLTKPEVKHIAIGEPRSVPAGQYGTELLQKLGILEQVQSKFVLGSNVKSVMGAVETGDVDAGIVYKTDAQAADRVTVVSTADAKLHSPIRYPIAVLQSSKSIEAAHRFVEFLQSDAAQAVFQKYGFGIVKP